MDEKQLTEQSEEAVDVNQTEETVETEDEEITMEDIDRLSKVIQAEATKNQYETTVNEIKDKQEEMLGHVVGGLSSDKDMIHEKLQGWTSESLKKYIYASKENTDKFFTDDATGQVFDVDIDAKNPEAKLEFKRGLLMYLKSTDEIWAKIDEEYKKIDEATEEFNESVHDAIYTLSDSILTYLSYMKEKAEKLPDGKEKRELLKGIYYEESGYTMAIYKETYLKYPSAIQHCKDDIKNAARVQQIGSRYIEKLQRTNTSVSLIPFVSDENRNMSFEERVLLADQYVTKDLFVFSLIRHFAMADWGDPNTKRAHAVIALVIKRLINNDFEDDEVKNNVVTAIVDYIKVFD